MTRKKPSASVYEFTIRVKLGTHSLACFKISPEDEKRIAVGAVVSIREDTDGSKFFKVVVDRVETEAGFIGAHYWP